MFLDRRDSFHEITLKPVLFTSTEEPILFSAVGLSAASRPRTLLCLRTVDEEACGVVVA